MSLEGREGAREGGEGDGGREGGEGGRKLLRGWREVGRGR